jgi:hypothetical protein
MLFLNPIQAGVADWPQVLDGESHAARRMREGVGDGALQPSRPYKAAPSRWLVILLFFAILLSLFRLSRTIWVLEHIIGLVTRPTPKNQ